MRLGLFRRKRANVAERLRNIAYRLGRETAEQVKMDKAFAERILTMVKEDDPDIDVYVTGLDFDEFINMALAELPDIQIDDLDRYADEYIDEIESGYWDGWFDGVVDKANHTIRSSKVNRANPASSRPPKKQAQPEKRSNMVLAYVKETKPGSRVVLATPDRRLIGTVAEWSPPTFEVRWEDGEVSVEKVEDYRVLKQEGERA